MPVKVHSQDASKGQRLARDAIARQLRCTIQGLRRSAIASLAAEDLSGKREFATFIGVKEPGMQPVFFSNRQQWRKWLKENHKAKSELLVGYYKKHTGKPCITWEESVEEALCFGWIDGLRKSLGKESYCIRFTPRKCNSAWSAVNLRLMEKLIQEKRMTKAGLDIYKVRKTGHANYGYEQKRIVPLSKALEALFTKNKKAWKYFQAQRPSYRNICTRWVMSARQEATREKRLAQLISFSSKEEWIPGMRWGKKQ